MGIGPISDYNSFFANYKVPEIPSVDFSRVQKNDAVSVSEKTTGTQSEQTVNDIDLSIEEKPIERSNASVHDMSLSFNVNEDYGYIGRDSEIESLDMQKAISDMKKDQVLQQYQYFVGSANDLFSGDTGKDGLVFMKF